MYTKIDINEINRKVDACLNRLNDYDRFLQEYFKIPFWKRWVFGKRIVFKYIESMKNKYQV